MTTTNHPSSLPEQEPTSPTAAVLCDGEAWVNTGDWWESLTQWLGAWGDLRNLAAEKGGATLFDLANLPAGLTEAQKEAVRSIESKFVTRGGISTEIRKTFPEAFADDRVTVKWKSGGDTAELLRVAEMEGAHAVAEWHGVTHSGPAKVRRDAVDYQYLAIGDAVAPYHLWFHYPDWTITVTAPKPADPTGGDPVVRASLVSCIDYKKCIFFRAQDGRWSRACDSERGMWDTSGLADIERLSAQTIAELMGGAS